MHAFRSSQVVLLQHSFTTARVTGTLIPRNLSPSPYCPGPVLKNRANPATCDGSACAIIFSKRTFPDCCSISLLFVSQN